MRSALLLVQFAFYIGTYAETFYPGCIVFCGASNDACLDKCAASAIPVTDNPEKSIQMEFIAKLPTKSEITGSDMFEMRRDGLVYFTTREGDVWRFIPKPIGNNSVLTKIYTLPDSFRLDTSADKGLYDIAFLRNFGRSRAFYLCFAAKPPMGHSYLNHVLTVAEFVMLDGEKVVFSKIVDEVPQEVPYRSGGFMKGSSTTAATGHMPLWISSGGNQEHKPDLLENQPKYSSIYGIFPDKAMRRTPEKPIAPPSFALWANGLANPYECDYAALGKPNSIVCLTRHYSLENELIAVALFSAEPGHTFNEVTSSGMSTNGYSSVQKSHTYTDVFDATQNCVPDSLIYSQSNLLGYGFGSRVMLATPTCEEESFPESTLKILVRDYEERKWVLIPMPVDFRGKKLWGMQMIGAERTMGLFMAGRDLFTGDYEIYWLRNKEVKKP